MDPNVLKVTEFDLALCSPYGGKDRSRTTGGGNADNVVLFESQDELRHLTNLC